MEKMLNISSCFFAFVNDDLLFISFYLKDAFLFKTKLHLFIYILPHNRRQLNKFE